MDHILENFRAVFIKQARNNALKKICCATTLPTYPTEATQIALTSSRQEIRHLSEVDREYVMQFLVHGFMKNFYDVDHSVHFKSTDYLAIRQLYAALLKDIATDHLSPQIVEERHFERIQSLLQQGNPALHMLSRSTESQTDRVPPIEYSAQFQMDLLDLHTKNLYVPILDIGCGRHGQMVEYLRANNVQAYGIDRLQKNESYYISTDWLDFDYGREKWGTILCNLSFSTHFITHFLQEDTIAEQYARTYLNILISLTPGGSWIYAPSVPFMEDLLPSSEGYIVRRNAITDTFAKTVITRAR